jgi:ribosomal silencing factor RsfS
VQGRESEDWMLVDLGKYMIHCLTPKGRKDFDLEGIWSDEQEIANDPFIL